MRTEVAGQRLLVWQGTRWDCLISTDRPNHEHPLSWSLVHFLPQGVWLPELQKMVEAINTTFTKNFASIGCVGEISLQDDIDYDKFAIQIR